MDSQRVVTVKEVSLRANTALFTGRFQPPSIAHVATVETILCIWAHVAIGISVPCQKTFVDSRWLPYFEVSRNRFSANASIFASEEVKRMWDAWIMFSNLNSRVTCSLAPRPYLPEFSLAYPSDKYDMVYPSLHESDSDGDRVKHELFPQLMDREIFLIDPPFRLHNTRIRELVAMGRSWEEFIPCGAYDVFLEINGPKRISVRS